MVILGLDPGTATTGFGLIKVVSSIKSIYMNAGVISTDKSLPLEERLNIIFDDLTSLLQEFKPDIVCIEKLFFSGNITTGIPVSHARGVMMLACHKSNCKIYEVTPLQMKLALTGYGRATKNQVQEMVKRNLNLKTIPKPDDAADALAIALSYSFMSTNL
jgi:crossover junction endodeoxyribonuclease RuvC